MQFWLKANSIQVLDKSIELNLITHLQINQTDVLKLKLSHTHIKTNIIQVNAINKTC